MQARIRSMVVGLTAACSMTLGCQQAPQLDVDHDPLEFDQIEQNLWVLSSAIWPSPVIPVCFESTAFSRMQTVVREAIRDTWEAESSVVFEGWDAPCQDDAQGIRILMARSGTTNSRVSALGSRLDGLEDGMLLNMALYDNQDGTYDEVELAATAIHEFGHALGFAHEHLRTDEEDCPAVGTGTLGDTRIGEYDRNSVMNYSEAAGAPDGCDGRESGLDELKLSPNDIAGAQRYYGAPRQISAVDGARGLWSLDVAVKGGSQRAWRWASGGDENGWRLESNERISGSPALALREDKKRDLVFRRTYLPDDGDPASHASNDGLLRQRWSSLTSSSWGVTNVPLSQDDMTRGTPIAVGVDDGHLEILTRYRTARPLRVYYDNGWNSEIVGGGVSNARGGLAAWYQGLTREMHVFWRDETNTLNRSSYNVSSSSGTAARQFRDLPRITSTPAVVANKGVLRVYARAENNALREFTCSTSDSDCSSYKKLGGQFTGNPAAVSRVGQEVVIFVRGLSGQLWMRTRYRYSWSSWKNTGSPRMTGSPTAVTMDDRDGWVAVFIRTEDGSLAQGSLNPETDTIEWVDRGGWFM